VFGSLVIDERGKNAISDFCQQKEEFATLIKNKYKKQVNLLVA
jgi:hypothetical protein